MSASVYAIATMDTKGAELEYVAKCLKQTGLAVRCVDVGTQHPPTVAPDVTREEVIAASSHRDALNNTDRGAAVTAMSAALGDYLQQEMTAGRILGVIGLGGGGGTALLSAAMQQLPIGLPKLICSTMASGNTAPYVGESDLVLFPSVVDVAGLNSVSVKVLANAANALAGMVQHNAPELSTRPAIGMTMFGVTTPCVTRVREQLEDAGYDCLVFHATGTGGRAMEKLVSSGNLCGILDVTTTEVADEVVGGVLNCGPQRFDATLQKQLPFVLSLGALDMVNFGGKETVPAKFRDRLFHVHNEQVTLMRTTADELRSIACWIAAKLRGATSPVTIVIPQGGVSALDARSQPFYDTDANAVLFETLENELANHPHVRLVHQQEHINDPAFADALVKEFISAMQTRSVSAR